MKTTCRISLLASAMMVATISLERGSFGADAFGFSPSFASLRTETALDMAMRRGRPKGPLRTFEIKPPMNSEINFKEVRVTLPADGVGKDESLGVMSKADAVAKAKEIGADLILINENGDPPVCKIMDYSKFRYIKEKAAKEKKKNSKSTEIKEIKMSYKIDVHDYQVRKRNTERFIMQGNRVKCSVVFRGREIQHDDLGFDLLKKLQGELEDILIMEGRPKKEGRAVSCIMSPRPDVLKKINEQKRANEKAKKKSKQLEKAEKNAPKGMDDDTSDEDAVDDDDDEDEADEDDGESVEELIKGDAVTDDLFA
jgi:translation initiation factor IF-3